MDLNRFYTTDIGINADPLYNVMSKYKDTIFVDLGVRSGVSSEIMLLDSHMNNNKVFGVDVDWSMLNPSVKSHPNYTTILGDSSTVGKYWNQKISGLFVDTFHIKEQVLSELYFWYSHIEEGGFIAFHDTNWPEGKHDVYNEITWDRVEEGVKSFFNVDSLNYEDEYIKMVNYPESWGMTIVEIKKKKDYVSEFPNWEEVINKRNNLISFFWDEGNKSNVKIDLVLNV
jgi:trans-aconitate methyltransferase